MYCLIVPIHGHCSLRIQTRRMLKPKLTRLGLRLKCDVAANELEVTTFAFKLFFIHIYLSNIYSQQYMFVCVYVDHSFQAIFIHAVLAASLRPHQF